MAIIVYPSGTFGQHIQTWLLDYSVKNELNFAIDTALKASSTDVISFAVPVNQSPEWATAAQLVLNGMLTSQFLFPLPTVVSTPPTPVSPTTINTPPISPSIVSTPTQTSQTPSNSYVATSTYDMFSMVSSSISTSIDYNVGEDSHITPVIYLLRNNTTAQQLSINITVPEFLNINLPISNSIYPLQILTITASFNSSGAVDILTRNIKSYTSSLKFTINPLNVTGPVYVYNNLSPLVIPTTTTTVPATGTVVTPPVTTPPVSYSVGPIAKPVEPSSSIITTNPWIVVEFPPTTTQSQVPIVQPTGSITTQPIQYGGGTPINYGGITITDLQQLD